MMMSPGELGRRQYTNCPIRPCVKGLGSELCGCGLLLLVLLWCFFGGIEQARDSSSYAIGAVLIYSMYTKKMKASGEVAVLWYNPD